MWIVRLTLNEEFSLGEICVASPSFVPLPSRHHQE